MTAPQPSDPVSPLVCQLRLSPQALRRRVEVGILGGLGLVPAQRATIIPAQATSLARLRRLYFSAYDPKGGGVEHGARVFTRSTCHHQPEVIGGLGEGEAATLLQRFFGERR